MSLDYCRPYFVVNEKYGIGLADFYKKGPGAVLFEDGTILNVGSDITEHEFQSFRLFQFRLFLQDEFNNRKKLNPKYLKINNLKVKESVVYDDRIVYQLSEEDHTERVSVDLTNRFYPRCSCGIYNCQHVPFALLDLTRRCRDIIGKYYDSDYPFKREYMVYFPIAEYLDDEDYEKQTIGYDEVLKIKDMVGKSFPSESPDYIGKVLNMLINANTGRLHSPTSNYNKYYLDDHRFTVAALMLDSRIRKVVSKDEDIFVKMYYEDRQVTSNKAYLRDISKSLEKYEALASSNKTIPNSENPMLEFYLAYTDNFKRLLEYLAKSEVKMDARRFSLAEAALKNVDPVEIPGNILVPISEKLDMAPEDLLPRAETLVNSFLLDRDEKTVYSILRKLRRISVDASLVKQFSPERRKDIIKAIKPDAENIKYILCSVLGDAEEREKANYLLFLSYRADLSINAELLLYENISLLKDSGFMSAYTLAVRKKLADKNAQIAPYTIPSKECITRYFRTAYSIKKDGKNVISTFDIVDPEHGTIVASSVRENEGKTTVSDKDCVLKVCNPEIVAEICIEADTGGYKRLYSETRESIDIDNFRRENSYFIERYTSLCNSFENVHINLTEANKVHLSYAFSTDYKGNLMVELKVGNEKEYVVKNVSDFLNAFANETTVEYGKGLVLTHKTSNFCNDDIPILRILLSINVKDPLFRFENRNRLFAIPGGAAKQVLELLKGRTVLFEERPALVRLAPQKVKISLDRSYKMIPELNGGEFFCLGSSGYIVSPGDKKDMIDIADMRSDELKIIDFACKNSDVSIKPILSHFRKNIYARFFDIIDVDPAIKDQLKISAIKINVYFDYDDSIITEKTSITKDNDEIRKNEIVEKIDLDKYGQFVRYLDEIGFRNGVIEEESKILSFMKMDFSYLRRIANVYLSETLKRKQIISVKRQTIRVKYKDSTVMQVFLEEGEFTEEELAKILAGIKKKKKFILLDSDRIVDLDGEEARELGDAVKDFGLNFSSLYKKKTVPMSIALKAFAHEKNCRIDKYLRNMIEDIRNFKSADIEIPQLMIPLRDYQEEGFRWLSILTKYNIGGILGDDMGLGKSAQIIALVKSDKASKPSLIVCPKSLVFNWIHEFSKFDGYTPVLGIYGSVAKRREIINSINYGRKAVYVTSYDSLRNDVSLYTGTFNFGILDEAQFIKNVNALKTQSVKELNVCHRLALTGTPIENSVMDLWSIFDYVMPGYFEDFSVFKSETALEDGFAEKLAKKVAPFILRRVKEDVLDDLPPKFERVLSAEMTPEQRKIYSAIREDAANRLSRDGNAFEMLSYLTRLRQVCVDPGMFVENYDGGSGKADLIESLVPEYISNGHRILIFSQFVKGLNTVENVLSRLNIPYYMFTGDTSGEERARMIDEFNSDSGVDVFLISLKAGGTGINLTGADTVIHLDPWWNTAAENQASDRAHRIGQERNVEVIKLIAEDSIEQRVIELQEIKKDLIDKIISDDDSSVTNTTIEDIAFILGQSGL